MEKERTLANAVKSLLRVLGRREALEVSRQRDDRLIAAKALNFELQDGMLALSRFVPWFEKPSMQINHLERDLGAAINKIKLSLDAVLNDYITASTPKPKINSTAAEITEELLALNSVNDYWKPVIDTRERTITVTTKEIVLTDDDDNSLALGKFALKWNWHSSVLHCIALSPNRPSGDRDVTHPHVTNDRLCMGEAETAINRAFADFRFTDAFLLIESVLHNYYEDSVYVPINEWDVPSCGDCGATDRTLTACVGCANDRCRGCARSCTICDSRFCYDCTSNYGCCQVCDDMICSGCIEDAPTCADHGAVCGNCRKKCRECSTTICNSRSHHRVSGYIYCNQCVEICYHCGRAVQKARLTEFDGEKYCQSCTFKCVRCDKQYTRCDESTVPGVCSSCFDAEEKAKAEAEEEEEKEEEEEEEEEIVDSSSDW